eukprot:196405_1
MIFTNGQKDLLSRVNVFWRDERMKLEKLILWLNIIGIYTISSCNKDEYLNIDGDDEIYSQHNVDFDTPDDEIYKYEIGHIEPCYTNDVCEYVVLDEKDGGGLLINQAGWKVFGGVVIILCSLILCGFALFCKCKQFKTWLDVRGNKHHNRRDSGSVARIDR